MEEPETNDVKEEIMGQTQSICEVCGDGIAVKTRELAEDLWYWVCQGCDEWYEPDYKLTPMYGI